MTDPRAAADGLLRRIEDRDAVAADWPDVLPPPPAGAPFWFDTEGRPVVEPRGRVRARCASDRAMVLHFLEALTTWEEHGRHDRARGMVSVSTFGARARYDAWREAVVLVAADYGMSWPSETRTGVTG